MTWSETPIVAEVPVEDVSGAGPWQLQRGEERKLSSRMGNETSKVCTLLGLPILV